MILFIKDDRRAGSLEWLPGACSWLHDIDLTCPLLELAVRGVQRGTPINTHGFSCFLESLLDGFFFIPFITLTISFFLLPTSSRFLLLMWGLTAAAPSASTALPSSTLLAFIPIPLLVLSLLLFDKFLNLVTLLVIDAKVSRCFDEIDIVFCGSRPSQSDYERAKTSRLSNR